MSLLVVGIMFLFCLTTRIDCLAMHGVYNLLRLSKSFSYMLAPMRVVIVDIDKEGGAAAVGADAKVGRDGATGTDANVAENVNFSESNTSESSNSISSLAELYFLLCTSLGFIPSVSWKALMTRKLLV